MGPLDAAREDPASVVADVKEEKTPVKEEWLGCKKKSTALMPSKERKIMRICIFDSSLQLIYIVL